MGGGGTKEGGIGFVLLLSLSALNRYERRSGRTGPGNVAKGRAELNGSGRVLQEV